MTATDVAVRYPALDALADLYLYPDAERLRGMRAAVATIVAACPDAAQDLEPLVALVRDAERARVEELFIGTFELNPLCALEIGWQLYGEKYARGTFMVRLRQLQRDAGLPPTTELPDHVTNVLRVLARLDGPSAEKLAVRFTLPALRGMQETLAAKPDNPHRGLLRATQRVIEHHYGEAEVGRE